MNEKELSRHMSRLGKKGGARSKSSSSQAAAAGALGGKGGVRCRNCDARRTSHLFRTTSTHRYYSCEECGGTSKIKIRQR